MIRVGCIGYGYWGPNLVRNFQETANATVAVVCDGDSERLSLAQRRHPHLRLSTSADDVIRAADVDLIAIATPASSHYDLARRALEAGKHVLVAKPLATSIDAASRLVELAEARGRVLAVDHTYVYHPAVAKIYEVVRSGELGEPYYYDSTRVNLGLIQSDVSVVWDLAAHDFSIVDYVFEHRPLAVSARGVAHVGERETVAYVFVRFERNFVVHINMNWLAPRKVRTVFIGGSQKMVVYDDGEISEKVRIYDQGVLRSMSEDRHTMLNQYRTGDTVAPRVQLVEALRLETEHLVDCVERGGAPLADGHHALRVVRLLAAAEESLRCDGKEIAI